MCYVSTKTQCTIFLLPVHTKQCHPCSPRMANLESSFFLIRTQQLGVILQSGTRGWSRGNPDWVVLSLSPIWSITGYMQIIPYLLGTYYFYKTGCPGVSCRRMEVVGVQIVYCYLTTSSRRFNLKKTNHECMYLFMLSSYIAMNHSINVEQTVENFSCQQYSSTQWFTLLRFSGTTFVKNHL